MSFVLPMWHCNRSGCFCEVLTDHSRPEVTHPVEVVRVSTFGQQTKTGFYVVRSNAGVQFLVRMITYEKCKSMTIKTDNILTFGLHKHSSKQFQGMARHITYAPNPSQHTHSDDNLPISPEWLVKCLSLAPHSLSTGMTAHVSVKVSAPLKYMSHSKNMSMVNSGYG